MKSSSRPIKGLLVAAAMFGTLAAHYLGYLLAEPHPEHRHSLLSSTGHGYLPAAIPLAISAGILAIYLAGTIGWRRGRRRFKAPLDRGTTTLRLLGLQVTGFLLIEFGERLLSGVSLDGIAPVLVLGVMAQMFIAVAIASILHVVGTVAEALAKTLAPSEHRTHRGRKPQRGAPICPAGLLQPVPIRGPPASPLTLC